MTTRSLETSIALFKNKEIIYVKKCLNIRSTSLTSKHNSSLKCRSYTAKYVRICDIDIFNILFSIKMKQDQSYLVSYVAKFDILSLNLKVIDYLRDKLRSTSINSTRDPPKLKIVWMIMDVIVDKLI
jgi:carboxypeptidase C (cathepsin A)